MESSVPASVAKAHFEMSTSEQQRTRLFQLAQSGSREQQELFQLVQLGLTTSEQQMLHTHTSQPKESSDSSAGSVAIKNLVVKEYRPDVNLQVKPIGAYIWEGLKQRIRDLYIAQDKPAKEVLQLISDPVNEFNPTYESNLHFKFDTIQADFPAFLS